MSRTTSGLVVCLMGISLGLAGCSKAVEKPVRDQTVFPQGSTVIALPGSVAASNSGVFEAGLAGFDPSGTVALLGNGFNTANSTVRGQCVDGAQPKRVDPASTSNFTIEILRKGTSEILPSLNDLDGYRLRRA